MVRDWYSCTLFRKRPNPFRFLKLDLTLFVPMRKYAKPAQL
jgi:hypothetical protein